MTGQVKVNLQLDETKTKVTLSLVHASDNTPIGYVELPAENLESLIGALATARAEILPQVAREIANGAGLSSVVDPAWRTKGTDDFSALALRHPGLGWLSFALPKQEAQNLGEALLRASGEVISKN